MDTKSAGGSCWPIREQELLLRASLLQGKEATDAWHEWKSIVDIDRLDQGSFRLLPQLYRNLRNQGINDPLVNRFRGVYRQTWYKNQVLFHNIASLLRSFHDSGIETMILKGAALILLYYKNYGLRPMNDFDVLIHMEQVLPAIKLLRKLGWIPMDFAPAEKYISVSYSHGFRNEKGQELDLHWHVLSQCRETNSDDDFWKGAIGIKIHDVATYALNPTDQLLHICIHGARWSYTPPFRWISDSMMILNMSQSEIDWNRLIAQARKRSLILPLREALTYLRKEMDVPIPEGILRSIRDIALPSIEHIEYRAAVSPPTRWTAVLDLWCQHSRLMENSGLFHRLLRFPIFLQYIWGKSLLKLPFYAMSRVMNWQGNASTKKP